MLEMRGGKIRWLKKNTKIEKLDGIDKKYLKNSKKLTFL